MATRSRAAATSCSHVVQHLDDEPAHQQAVRPVAGAAAGRRGTTEERLSSMERRLEASDKMLQEVHAMVRGLQQLPATNALPAPPPVADPAAMSASAGGEPIAPPLANLCLWAQGGHTSSRVASYAAGAPPSPVPRPRSAPWPEAISSGIHTGNEVHTLPRASQDLVASFALSRLPYPVIPACLTSSKPRFGPGTMLVFPHCCMTPHHKAIMCQLGQAVTTRPPCSVSPLGQGAALCHLTNGCRVSKFTCLSFYFSRNTWQNHTTCSCTSRRFVLYMRRVQTGGRMTRHSGRFVRLTTGGVNRFAGTCG